MGFSLKNAKSNVTGTLGLLSDAWDNFRGNTKPDRSLDRINQLMSMQRMLYNAGIDPNTEQYKVNMEMWDQYGKPHILEGSPNARDERASFLFNRNYPNQPDTLSIDKGNIGHYLAEMAHAQQFTTLDRDSLNVENTLQRHDHGDDDVYDVPGTVEYDAHTVKELVLRRKNAEAKVKDHEAQIRKSKKNDKGLLGLLKGLFD